MLEIAARVNNAPTKTGIPFENNNENPFSPDCDIAVYLVKIPESV